MRWRCPGIWSPGAQGLSVPVPLQGLLGDEGAPDSPAFLLDVASFFGKTSGSVQKITARSVVQEPEAKWCVPSRLRSRRGAQPPGGGPEESRGLRPPALWPGPHQDSSPEQGKVRVRFHSQTLPVQMCPPGPGTRCSHSGCLGLPTCDLGSAQSTAMPQPGALLLPSPGLGPRATGAFCSSSSPSVPTPSSLLF